ncbi:tail fiber assembly protein [Enterobacteriaceae bacterium LUAb1]
MAAYQFSPSENVILPLDLKELYLNAGTWPVDALDISDEQATEFMSDPPEGKKREAGPNGIPEWVDIPPPTHDEAVEAAEQYRQQLLREIDEVTADWRVELMLGDISDEDKDILSEWMAYKKRVKAVDSSTAPALTWPTEPTR